MDAQRTGENMTYDETGILQFTSMELDMIHELGPSIANDILKKEQEAWSTIYTVSPNDPSNNGAWFSRLTKDATYFARVKPRKINPPKPILTHELLLKEFTLALKTQGPLMDMMRSLKDIADRADHLLRDN